MKGYCFEGEIDHALRVMVGMKSLENFAPDEIMYNSLLDGCAKKQLVDEGLRLLDEMREAHIAPSNYTSNPFMACSSESQEGSCMLVNFTCSALNVAMTCGTFGKTKQLLVPTGSGILLLKNPEQC